jgi:uncharacterized protein YkwD
MTLGRMGTILCALALAACATPGPGTPPQPGGAPATSGAPVPSAQPAGYYRTVIENARPSDPLAARLVSEIDADARKRSRAPLAHDARLNRVAHDLALLTSKVGIPPSAAVAFLLAHYGIIEPEPNLILMRGGNGAEDSAVTDLRRQLATIPGIASWRRVGVGVGRSTDGWVAVLAFAEHHIEIEPLPRTLDHDGQAVLSGRVLGDYREPEVLVTSPGGTVRRLVLTADVHAFRTTLACSEGDGTYQVEVMATDARGPTVLANFPLYCGIAAPGRLPDQIPMSASSVKPEQVEAQLLELMDRDRAANGLPALIRDPRLAKVARRYSREMAETGDVAHFSRRSGNAVDRVRSAGITPSPTVIAENVGRDYSAADAERGFMSSPGHRDNILSRAVTHVGVGVVAGPAEGGMVPLFFTQIFAGWGQ